MVPGIADVVEPKAPERRARGADPLEEMGPVLSGDAWNNLTHYKARSRAYKWGEDGLGGLCDDEQLLCLRWRCGMSATQS
jgi:hypothetical protein